MTSSFWSAIWHQSRGFVYLSNFALRFKIQKWNMFTSGDKLKAIHQKRQILIQQISVSFLKCQKCLKTLNWARSGDKKMWLKSYYNITSTRLETFEEVCNLYELNLIQNLFGYRVRLQDRARNLATLLRLGTPRDKGEICSHCHFTQHLQRLISFQIESTFTTELLILKRRQTFYYNNAHCLQTPL